MTLKELVDNYCFHDSLLENFEYDPDIESVRITIDFCNWAQSDYNSDRPSTQTIFLVFTKVQCIIFEQFKIDNDTILSCELAIHEEKEGVKFVIVRDEFHDVRTLFVSAHDVSFVCNS